MKRTLVILALVGALATTSCAQLNPWMQVYYSGSSTELVDTVYTWLNDTMTDQVLMNVYCTDPTTRDQNVYGDPTANPPTWSDELKNLTTATVTAAGTGTTLTFLRAKR